MEQFSLEKWLQDKSLKVVTRYGSPVRIVCLDAKMECPIMALALNKSNNKELALHYHVDGTYSPLMESDVDLFFADEEKCNKILNELKSYLKSTPKEQVEKDWKEIQDWYAQHFTNEKHNEEEELTEFEKCVQNILNEPHFQDVQSVKQFSKTLLDLARKELEANYYTKVIDDRMVFKSELHEQSLQTAYDMGKQDVLKDLPKWKKITEEKQNYLAYGYLSHDGYYLSIQELKDKLPKEK